MALNPDFLTRPLAHRGLHDRKAGIVENSPSAFRAAIAAGYGIELDIQMSADQRAMVFHDDDLDRLTYETGPIRTRVAADLRTIRLKDSTDTIPTLAEVLKLVAGQVPLLIEIKDQDGAMGPNIGPLEAATAGALRGYGGPIAVMSFNPNSVAEMARICPDVPRGITTSSYDPDDWPFGPAICERLRDIPDFDRVKAVFISHESSDLGRARVRELRASGVPVLCWTIRSAEADAQARLLADNVTFEGYLPAAVD